MISNKRVYLADISESENNLEKFYKKRAAKSLLLKSHDLIRQYFLQD
jgi:hypothetical protein